MFFKTFSFLGKEYFENVLSMKADRKILRIIQCARLCRFAKPRLKLRFYQIKERITKTFRTKRSLEDVLLSESFSILVSRKRNKQIVMRCCLSKASSSQAKRQSRAHRMITIIGHPASEPGRFVIFLLFKQFTSPYNQAAIGLEGDFEISFLVEFERGEGGLTFFVVDVELGKAGEVR